MPTTIRLLGLSLSGQTRVAFTIPPVVPVHLIGTQPALTIRQSALVRSVRISLATMTRFRPALTTQPAALKRFTDPSGGDNAASGSEALFIPTPLATMIPPPGTRRFIPIRPGRTTPPTDTRRSLPTRSATPTPPQGNTRSTPTRPAPATPRWD